MDRQILKLLTVLLLSISVNIAFAAAELEYLPESAKIVCPEYPPARQHLQGFQSCGKYIYWVFSQSMVKTDLAGKLIKKVPLHRERGKMVHGGSPALLDKLYVPYSGSGFNKRLNGKPSLNFVQVYDLDLNYIKSIPIPELEYGAGAVTTDGTNFFVTGGRPADLPGNTIYEYSRDFKLLKKHELRFNTFKGIQTLAFDGKYFYAGCYGSAYMTYRISKDFKQVDYMDLQAQIGAYPIAENRMLVGSVRVDKLGREETFIQVVDPTKYILKTAVFELDCNYNVFYKGKMVPAKRLYGIIKKQKSTLAVLRCPANTPLSKIVELQVYIPVKYIVEYYNPIKGDGK
ncbi:MAG: hypothetical protein IKA65_07070 [Lentisphaeria bacterium]|nr:hypothetical protein [Lentisphaeria bacterium]